MSDLFALDEQGNRALAEEARMNAIDLSQADLPLTQGLAKGVGHGVMRGGARVGQFISLAGAAAIKPFLGPNAPPEALDPYFKAVDEYANNAVDYWTPAQGEVGKAGQVLGGLSEIALPLMAGAGNPTLLIGAQELGTAADLSRQGVDAGTAVTAGVIQGTATAVGFKLPFLGGTLASRMASGAGGNLITNTVSAAATRELLKSEGYDDQAAAFDPLDPTARFVDVLTGLAFGAIAHGTAPRMTPSQRAAIATAANAKHFQSDTAPGIPADLNSAVAHQAAMEQAVRQLIEGDAVTAPAGADNALFVPREQAPATAVPPEFKALDSERAAEVPTAAAEIPRAAGLSPADRAIETQFAEQIGANPEAAARAYDALPDAAGGKILNTDLARELSKDYLKDRSGKSAAVHEPASWLVKYLYAKKLAEAPGKGEKARVIFSAGGTGAGKTSGLALLKGAADKAQLIYDTNMNRFESARQKIDQALAAGKDVRIVYTFRDPLEALTQGALPRAMRQEAKFGSGRTVPIDEHLGTHVGSRQAIEQIAAHYAGDNRVHITVVDNSGGKGAAKLVALSQIPKPAEGAYNGLREKAVQTLDAERAAGRISEAVHNGTVGLVQQLLPNESGSRSVLGPTGAGDRGQPESTGAGGRVDPIVTAARTAALDPNLKIPTGEIAADGSAAEASAADVLARSDVEIAQAQNDAKGFEAAVNCFLQRGAA